MYSSVYIYMGRSQRMFRYVGALCLLPLYMYPNTHTHIYIYIYIYIYAMFIDYRCDQ